MLLGPCMMSWLREMSTLISGVSLWRCSTVRINPVHDVHRLNGFESNQHPAFGLCWSHITIFIPIYFLTPPSPSLITSPSIWASPYSCITVWGYLHKGRLLPFLVACTKNGFAVTVRNQYYVMLHNVWSTKLRIQDCVRIHRSICALPLPTSVIIHSTCKSLLANGSMHTQLIRLNQEISLVHAQRYT